MCAYTLSSKSKLTVMPQKRLYMYIQICVQYVSVCVCVCVCVYVCVCVHVCVCTCSVCVLQVCKATSRLSRNINLPPDFYCVSAEEIKREQKARFENTARSKPFEIIT